MNAKEVHAIKMVNVLIVKDPLNVNVRLAMLEMDLIAQVLIPDISKMSLRSCH